MTQPTATNNVVDDTAPIIVLAFLSVLPAVVPGVNQQGGGDQTSDQVAPAVPKMLELVQLFLFFEVEVRCHGVDALTKNCANCRARPC